MLAYPVVTTDKRYWHKGSFEYLLGDKFDENYDLENVSKDVEQQLRYLNDQANTGNTRLEEIYKSHVLASTFTKGIYDKAYDPNNPESDSSNFLVHNNIAYKAGTSIYRVEEIKDLILKALHKYFTEHEYYEENELLKQLESCTDEDIIWLKRMAGEE